MLAVRRLGGCLLGLLLGAADAVAVEALAHPHLGGEGLHVVGALVLDDVLGDAEAVLGGRAPGGRSSSPGRRRAPTRPRSAGRRAGARPRRRCSMPPLRWTAPITASTVSERIDALSRPPVVSSPRPSLTWSPRPMVRATSASARALTTAARSLASRPSERSGWHEVERLGDDDAEHGVAEELEALVGGQPAVLVGVGAVRQGALEQLGVQLGIPERGAQLVVVDAWRPCSGPGQRT